MRTRRTATIQDLRLAIDCLPRHTKIAMLQGIDDEQIIAGAYTDRGGICPMLAAHRRGGRTDFIAFARAWDSFVFRGTRKRLARRATERELLVLRSHLQASLLGDPGVVSPFASVIAEHQALQDARRERVRRARADDADRSAELRNRPGWSWLRVVRRWDDYQRALQVLRDGQLEAERGQRTQAR